MRRPTVSALLALCVVGCGGAVTGPTMPPECIPGPLTCTAEVLNDGAGPDDHRSVCSDGEDTWILYPSGETWHLAGGRVLCRLLADGSVFWSEAR